MMKNTNNIIRHLLLCLFMLSCSIKVVLAQERLNEFVVNIDESHNPITIYSSYGATPNDGVVIVNSTMPNLEFGIMSVAKERLRKVVHDKGKNRYVLIIQPNDSYYKQYTITINAKGFKQGQINSVVVKAGLSTGYVVNPKHGGNKNVDPLYVDGWSIYRNGKKLGDNEIKALFANTESYELYVQGIKKKEGGTLWGDVMIYGGSISALCGGIFLSLENTLNIQSFGNMNYWYIGGGLAAIGTGLLVRQINFSIGKNKIRDAVNYYNNGNLRSNNLEMEYGLTGNGVYFSLLF